MDLPPSPARAFAPTPFHDGRFLLLEEIGRGGTGAIYKARDNGVEARAVCIKRLANPLRPEVAVSLRREARLLSSVRHSHIVTLLGIGEEAGGPYLVLELIDGLDLAELGRRVIAPSDGVAANAGQGILPDRLAVHVACAVLRGLGALARAVPGFVHQDITPHNVLVSSEGEVKITDFGVALAAGRPARRADRVSGKAGYMSPEQIRGEPLDLRADLFAVGVLLYELLARRRPAQTSCGLVEELRLVERGDIEPLATHRPHLHTHLRHTVDRLLSPRRELRFASADIALQCLAPHGAGEIGSLRMAAIVQALRTASTANDSPSRPRATVIANAREDPDDA